VLIQVYLVHSSHWHFVQAAVLFCVHRLNTIYVNYFRLVCIGQVAKISHVARFNIWVSHWNLSTAIDTILCSRISYSIKPPCLQQRALSKFSRLIFEIGILIKVGIFILGIRNLILYLICFYDYCFVIWTFIIVIPHA
jgi:hypothetical protein